MNQISIPYKLRLLNSNKEVSDELIEIIKEYKFLRVAIITTKTPTHLISDSLEVSLFRLVEKIKTFQVIDASISYVNQLELKDFDVIIGVGGGKVIDVAKYAAHVNDVSFISIPTTISNDGICSPISVLKEKNNKYKSLGAKVPIALLVPLHIVEKAGEEAIISGIGDLLSNLSAIEDWKLANKEKGEHIDDFAILIAKNAALTIKSLIEVYILHNKTKSEFLNENITTVIESLALSGVAMEIAGTSRPASGAEHLISHSIDELYGGMKPHGIQVAFSMLITTFLRAELGYIPKRFLQELKVVLRFLGIPTTLQLMEFTKEQLVETIIYAPQTRADRYTILNKIKLENDFIAELISKLFIQNLVVSVN